MEGSYQKDMSRSNWERVYHRQELRAEQAAQWLDALALRPGDRVADIGSGPGYISLLAARRVGPTGRVWAVDRQPDALEYLGRRQAEEGLTWIERIAADAAAMAPLPEPVGCALVTMMLHHVDDPRGLLLNLGRVLPEGARVLIGEFHPEGPCEVGAPREQRIHPDQARLWCQEAGMAVLEYIRQSPEHYMVLARVGDRLGAE